MPESQKISVIVPTCKRPTALRRCLAALASQTVPIEIVVADDDPAAGQAGQVAAVAGAAGAGVVRTGGAGPAAARNAGARAASGAILCFTDDDCMPDPDWAEALANGCPPGGSAAAGETVNGDHQNRVTAASQLLTSELMRATLGPDGRLGFAPTSNLALARELFERLPFDESYPAAAGEDRAWCAAAAELGAAPAYVPGAVVRHFPELGIRGFARQQIRYGRGAALYRATGRELAGGRVRGRLIRAGFREGAAVGALVALAQAAVAVGYAAERLRPSRTPRHVP